MSVRPLRQAHFYPGSFLSCVWSQTVFLSLAVLLKIQPLEGRSCYLLAQQATFASQRERCRQCRKCKSFCVTYDPLFHWRERCR